MATLGDKTTGANALWILSKALLLLIWAALMPLAFVALYTTIEVQSAAKAAGGTDAKLATYAVTSLAQNIRDYHAEVRNLRNQTFGLQVQVDEKNDAWATAQQNLIEAIVVVAAELSTPLPIDCSKDVEATKACYLRIETAGFAPTLDDPSHPNTIREEVTKIRPLMSAFQQADNERNQKTKEFSRVSALYDGERAKYDALIDPKAPEKINAVALTYNSMESLPLFWYLFPLPSGVVVAFFTAVMGAIGAAVYSLLAETTVQAPSERFSWYAYGARPFLGAMAGFMVFFVISAGAAFLVTPSGNGAASDAVNSLSPPALASLGVFAGLAAEKALKWLNVKAGSFFETDDSDEASRGAKAAEAE